MDDDLLTHFSRMDYDDLVRASRALIDISAAYGVLERLNLTGGEYIDYHELLGALDKEMKLRRQVARAIGARG